MKILIMICVFGLFGGIKDSVDYKDKDVLIINISIQQSMIQSRLDSVLLRISTDTLLIKKLKKLKNSKLPKN